MFYYSISLEIDGLRLPLRKCHRAAANRHKLRKCYTLSVLVYGPSYISIVGLLYAVYEFTLCPQCR